MTGKTHLYYPIYLDLRDRQCLVAGGGPIAAGKVSALLEAGARVTVVAPVVDPRIAQWHAEGRLVWQVREFRPTDIEPAFLVIAATDRPALNARIYELANSQLRLANAVDDAAHCNFIAPAVARAGAIQVAVSTSGKSPALAKQLRDEIKHALLTPERSRLADFLGEWRAEVKRALPTYQQRTVFWEGVLASPLPGLLQRNQSEQATRLMQGLIARAEEESRCK